MIKISITGPESTGKSALSRELARYFRAPWVPEYARKYLQDLPRQYTLKDIPIIAQGQLKEEEDHASKNPPILICDTDFLVLKIWSLFKYGECDPWIEKLVQDHSYDIYLLCDIDLPWVEDPLREHPHQRRDLFKIYLSELEKLGRPFAIVSGSGTTRLQNAITHIQNNLGI